MTMKKKNKLEPLQYQLPQDAIWEPISTAETPSEALRSLDDLAYTHRAVFDAKALIPLLQDENEKSPSD